MTTASERRTYVPGRRVEDVMRETGLAHVCKLASNENPLGPSPLAMTAMADALPGIAEYPDMMAAQTRAAVAAHLSLAPDRVVLGAGSDEILMFASCAALDSSKTAIVLEPTFPQYRQHSEARGADVISIRVEELTDSLKPIVAAASGRSGGIVWLANPNNPTGTVYSNEQIETLLEELGPDWLVVIDEAYVDFRLLDQAGAISLLDRHDNILITRTFSKIYGLAGLRVGFGVGAPDLITRLAYFRGPFNTSLLAQKAAIAALADSGHYELSRIINAEGRARLLDFCRRHALPHYTSEASFVLFKPPVDEMQYASMLEKRGYVVRPGAHLGAPGMIRITIGTSEQMDGLLEILESIQREL